jgi:hypothetical protein
MDGTDQWPLVMSEKSIQSPHTRTGQVRGRPP